MSGLPVTVSDLRESNDVLDNPEALRRRLLDDGYLFLRDVLDKDAVAIVRQGFMDALAGSGITSAADQLTWTGKVVPEYYQHPIEVAGQRLWENFVEAPKVKAFYERVMGDALSWFEDTIYRSVLPTKSDEWATGPHQDGFYNGGMSMYTTWIPLAEVDEVRGGLALSPGSHKAGFIHDQTKAPQFPIPPEALPKVWHRAGTYRPGDVVIFVNSMVHIGVANHSPDVRLSMDLRFLPRSEDQAPWGELVKARSNSVEISLDDGRFVRATVDNDSEIYNLVGLRIDGDQFAQGIELPLGSRVMVGVHDGHAEIIRPRLPNVQPDELTYV